MALFYLFTLPNLVLVSLLSVVVCPIHVQNLNVSIVAQTYSQLYKNGDSNALLITKRYTHIFMYNGNMGVVGLSNVAYHSMFILFHKYPSTRCRVSMHNSQHEACKSLLSDMMSFFRITMP